MRERLGLAGLGIVLASAFAAAYQAAPRGSGPPAPPPPVASISGSVVDGVTGAPVAGAEVKFNLLVQRGNAIYGNGPEWSARTNAAGLFRIPHAPIGGMRMHVTKEGYLEGLPGQLGPSDTHAPSWFFLDIAKGEQVKDIKIRLWRTSTIRGVVEDEVRDPVVGERVQLLQRRSDQGPNSAGFMSGSAPATTDDRGRFQFVNVRPGDYYVLVPSLQPAAGRRGMPQHLSVFYPGVLRLDDATVIRIGSGETLDGMNVTVGAGARRTMPVAGRLVGPPDRVESVEVRLLDANAPRGLETYAAARAITGSDGTFKFPSVTPGQYRIHVEAASAAMRRMLPRDLNTAQAVDVFWADETIVVDERDVTDLVVPLQTGARIRGRLTFDDGKPRPSPDELAWTSVYFQPDGTPGWTSWAPVDASGTFASAALPPGHYSLTWERPRLEGWNPSFIRADGRDAARAVELGTTDLNVELVMEARPTKVAGSVRDTQGRSVTLARVLVFPRDPSRWGAHPAMWLVRQVALNSKGQFSEQVPPGDYLVAAVSSVPANWSAPEFLETLAPRATRATPAAGERIELSLRVLPTP